MSNDNPSADVSPTVLADSIWYKKNHCNYCFEMLDEFVKCSGRLILTTITARMHTESLQKIRARGEAATYSEDVGPYVYPGRLILTATTTRLHTESL